MLTDQDKSLLSERHISEDQVIEQINQFKRGFPFTHLISPATVDNGIIKWNQKGLEMMVKAFEADKEYYHFTKFVPASGAASRMFKDLFTFIDTFKGKEIPSDFLQQTHPKFPSVPFFFLSIQDFAFYQDLKASLAKHGKDIDQLIAQNKFVDVAEALLTTDGLGLGMKPKALLKFHKYENYCRLAIEEHLVEAAQYAKNADGTAFLHFTVSPEHETLVKEIIETLKPDYEKKYKTHYVISFSTQKSSTDTVSVDLNNELFRDKDGNILFRPAGHGALIENLNELKEEIVFIKNIDNVVPERLIDTTVIYKKALAGYLLRLQQKCFEYLEALDEGVLEEADIKEIADFAHQRLLIDIPSYFSTYNEIEKIDFLYNKLNRPMRICGVVRNEGEPGGGPYWTKNQDDEVSLQIVESSQINHQNEKQEAIFKTSTHFNPVDLVCACWNYKGEPFNLLDYVDKNTGFISQKSKDGRDLKALELPGLWNGAMADWITIFVEVPTETFNPVKTVNDLLKESHR